MIVIDVKKEKSLDSALKKLKYKFTKNKTREELFSRQEFVKKSVIRREEIRKARYKENIKTQENF
jgi:small subunit ribosomal protein S21